MKYTLEQRQQISDQAEGKVISSLTWDDKGKYWVMIFEDGSEVCFRFMSELTGK